MIHRRKEPGGRVLRVEVQTGDAAGNYAEGAVSGEPAGQVGGCWECGLELLPFRYFRPLGESGVFVRVMGGDAANTLSEKD